MMEINLFTPAENTALRQADATFTQIDFNTPERILFAPGRLLSRNFNGDENSLATIIIFDKEADGVYSIRLLIVQ